MLNRTDQLERAFPLQDPEAEMRVLGTLLNSDVDVQDAIFTQLSPDAFSVAQHEAIYRRAMSDYLKGEIATLNGVVDGLKQSGELEKIGGRVAIARILECGMFVPDLKGDLVKLREYWLRRQAGDIGQSLWIRAANDSLNPQSVIEGTAQKLTELVTASDQRFELKSALEVAFESLDAELPPGIPTGFLDMDKTTGGIFPGQLTVAAGATGMGKTHFLIAQALGVAQHGPVVMFSCEMTQAELSARILANLSRVDAELIQQRRLDCEMQSKIGAAMGSDLLQNIWIYDSPNPSFAEVRAQIRRCTLKVGRAPVMVTLDYLQLLGDGSDNRVRELDTITRQCKQIAVEQNLHFLAASQINRAVAGRADKRPTLADLRESGAIENHANRVILLYRDDYYNPDSVDRGIVELNVAKNRGGKNGVSKMIFKPQYSLFLNLAA